MNDVERSAVVATIRRITGKEPIIRWSDVEECWFAESGTDQGDHWYQAATYDLAFIGLLGSLVHSLTRSDDSPWGRAAGAMPAR